MKLRPARHVDAWRIVELLLAKQADSIYAGRVAVDEPMARKLVSSLVQRHGASNDGASCVFVVEDDTETVCAFIVGALSRVYLIGDKLVAQDMFLVADKAAPATAYSKLIDAYVGWAESCPSVVEINLSWTDVAGAGEAMSAAYERKGFTRCGAIFRRDMAEGQGQ